MLSFLSLTLPISVALMICFSSLYLKDSFKVVYYSFDGYNCPTSNSWKMFTVYLGLYHLTLTNGQN